MKYSHLISIAIVSLLSSSCPSPSEPAPPRFRGAGLLILSIDTLRADRLGCYGYGRKTSPEIDSFAAESVLFENILSNSPFTAASHMTLFTSLPPSAHGVTNVAVRQGAQLKVLGKNRTTLGETLEQAGYFTIAVASDANLNARMGFGRGFGDRFDSRLDDVSIIVDRALAAADRVRNGTRPGFMFLHTYQVHAPYVPPAAEIAEFAPVPYGVVGERVRALSALPFEQQWREMHQGFWAGVENFGPEDAHYLSNLYDGEIHYTDREVGRLLRGLRERGLLDSMIVVILADHGEEFAEHGCYEHKQLFHEVLHVPFIVHLPHGQLGGTRIQGQASLIDVMPTLLDLLDVKGPTTMTGRSFASALRSHRIEDRPVFSELSMLPGDYQATLRTRTSAVTFHAKEESFGVFDLARDPAEKNDLGNRASFFPEQCRALHESIVASFALGARLDRVSSGGVAPLDENAKRDLERLGYVGDASSSASSATGSPLERWPADAPR